MDTHTMTIQALASSHGGGSQAMMAGLTLPSVNFEFEALRSKMSAFLTAFDGHVAGKREEMMTARQEHLRTMAQAKEEVARKESEMVRWRGKGQDLVKTLEREKREMAEVQEALTALSRQRKAMDDKRDRVLADMADLKQTLTQKAAVIQAQRDSLNHHEYKNSPELKFFEENLGLRILGVKHDVIAFEFSHIDERDWERTFTIKVDVSQRTYTVSECQPPLPDLAELVLRLNGSREFYQFIKSVRTSFQALVRDEKGGRPKDEGEDAVAARTNKSKRKSLVPKSVA